MVFEPIAHMKEMMAANGIGMFTLEPPFERISDIDGGLRARLFKNYDYRGITGRLTHSCKERGLYTVSDNLGLRYFILNADGADVMRLIVIGSYLITERKTLLEYVINTNKYPLIFVGALREHYNLNSAKF